MRTLPNELSDGTYQYELVRPEQKLEDGRSNIALYERMPEDPKFQFTPDLAFCEGQREIPVMVRVGR